MTEQQINQKILEFIKEIVNLSSEEQMKLSKMVSQDTSKENNKSMTNDVSTSLSNLSICLKYLLFDLEATRREKNILQKIVNNRRGEQDS